MRIKKTNRPHSYPPVLRTRWVTHTAVVSIEDATRKLGVNHQTIRNYMLAAGILSRRPGNFTLQESEMIRAGALAL